ncbi:MAG TPA: protein kinase [Reyranella sp.]|jgi:serine/threonine protein phosphatase PrpC|nr:protein kinase [Reyranella sp.]
MTRDLKISIGQHSDRGRKPSNQDFHGAMVPKPPLLAAKGIAVALADGISSSSVSRVAAESAVKGFLTDYYCTSETWSVKTSAQRVIDATNSWLYAQSRRGFHAEDRDRGYVCTFSAIIAKSATAHLFHIGDSRIYRLSGKALEQLTEDHRVVISSEETYLSRALGMNAQVEIDYRTVSLEKGDIFIQATDGVCEHIGGPAVAEALSVHEGDLDAAARAIAEEAFARGSADNLTVQLLRVDQLPDGEPGEVADRAIDLALPPLLEPRQSFDGYRIVRALHGSSRSHVYLAIDEQDERTVALKIPSIELREDRAYLRQFMMEEWIARRIDSAHVLKGHLQARKRNYLYSVTEFVEGITLAQWMIDNPRPDLETVRSIVEQIARGLRAFHRLEMLHRDLRPENVMIDRTGTARIIDFGSVRVAGIAESDATADLNPVPGAVQYAAPEYFLGEGGTSVSDLYSLGVITYQMLTGRLPYGAAMARARSRAQQRAVAYQSALDGEHDIPAWIDGVLKKAVHADPAKRYQELSEFVYDLRHPSESFLSAAKAPLIERNPLLFWKGLSVVLAAALVGVLLLRAF